MAKIVKVKKKRSMRLQVFTLLFFSVSLVMYLCSSLFLRSINNSLSTQKQQIETQIAALKVENDADGHIEPLFIDNDKKVKRLKYK